MMTADGNVRRIFEMEEDLNGLHEECGVFGIYDFDGGDVASSVYYGLLALRTVDRRAAESQ